MPDSKIRQTTEPLPLRIESTQILAPENFGGQIENLLPTDVGTLASIPGPTFFVPRYFSSVEEAYVVEEAGTTEFFIREAGLGNMAALDNSFDRAEVIAADASGEERGSVVGMEIVPMRAASRARLPSYEDDAPFDNAQGEVASYPQTRLLDDGSVFPRYVYPHGIFHGLLMQDGKDVTLIHNGSQIQIYHGWERAWFVLQAGLESPKAPLPPTQFELTPTGIVIAPRGSSRAYFYDGEVIAPLGYSNAPSAPVGYGPETFHDDDQANQRGYVVDGDTMATDFGFGRLGTVLSDPHSQKTKVGEGKDEEEKTSYYAGFLLDGSYQAAVQFIDRWGNLSPISERSNPVEFDLEHVYSKRLQSEVDSSVKNRGPLGRELKQVYWNNIEKGPRGTIGRVLLRTKDTKNKPTTELYEILNSSAEGLLGTFATIPDNSSEYYPDNRSDSELVKLATEVAPVPPLRLIRLAFGRLFATVEHELGAVMFSLPGTWGTFAANSKFYPDPSGGAVTGLWKSAGGLLIFTETSTFLIEENSDGDGFRSQTLSTNIGCSAPSSIASMPDGTTIWLSRNGFVHFDGERFSVISLSIQDMIEQINVGRIAQSCALVDSTTGEYRCWVPLNASERNNHCFVFNGLGWRRRTGEEYAAVCTTQDHRHYPMGFGWVEEKENPKLTDLSVYVMDHAASSADGVPGRESIIETAWINAEKSDIRKTAKTVYFWFRETSSGTIDVEVFANWRKTKPVYSTTKALLESPEDPPPKWGKVKLSSGKKIVKRRPYWVKVDIEVPSCETYKIRLRTRDRIDFIGMSMEARTHLPASRTPR